ncbi:hypothetical protein, partial [Slackia piriformis]|uniref:hypothetical protein n=1 Tax=Slackia piriformis TaxID=626934 RepID=UPI0023F21275
MAESFTFFSKIIEACDMLNENDRSSMLYAVAEYGASGKRVELPYPLDAMLAGFTEDIDNSKNARNQGSRGGKTRKRNTTEQRAESENEAPLASPLGSPHQNPDQTKPVQTSADQTIKKESASRFSPPSENEVRKYCEERGYGIDPATFVSYYASNGWMIGRSKMKDWKAAVR